MSNLTVQSDVSEHQLMSLQPDGCSSDRTTLNGGDDTKASAPSMLYGIQKLADLDILLYERALTVTQN